jgi:hypothetical protein
MATSFLTFERRFCLKMADLVQWYPTSREKRARYGAPNDLWCPKENCRSLGFAPNDKEEGECFQ